MLYPIKFKPILKYRIWGGSKISSLYNQQTNQQTSLKIGESWELCDRDGDNSIVENGSLAGKTLKEIRLAFKEKLLGTKLNFKNPFPIMVKLLDAESDLSVQVHPKKSDLHKFVNAQSKTEFWYMLQTSSNAQIIAGLKNTYSKKQLSDIISNGNLLKHVNYYNTQANQFYYLKSGLLHALLKGNFVLEIQENSDTTFRIFDYNRLEDNKPRELNIKESLQTINPLYKQNIKFIDNLPLKSKNNKSPSVLSSNLFNVNFYNITEPKTIKTNTMYCKIISIVKGEAIIEGFGEPIVLKQYSSALLPANLSFLIKPADKNVHFITTHYTG